MIYLVIRFLGSARQLWPALALVAVIAAVFVAVYRYEKMSADLASTRIRVEQVTAERDQIRARVDEENAISASREAEIKAAAVQTGDIRRMLDDAKNTDRDAPLPDLARDYLDRLREH